MKTAMQELIEYIESNEIVYNKDLILKLKELLEKEKEHIIEAYKGGVKLISGDVDDAAGHYYNQTYKP
jgi:calcineurin-like phosphoesterase family protein